MRISDWSSDVCSSDLETLFYIDPPYHPDTRSQGNRRRGKGFHVYSHELEAADHVRLLDSVTSLSGMVVLSGYPHPLYDEALPGWKRVERMANADGGRERTECLWINPAAVARLDRATLAHRSEEHTSELQSLMRNQYDVFCLKKKKTSLRRNIQTHHQYN